MTKQEAAITYIRENYLDFNRLRHDVVSDTLQVCCAHSLGDEANRLLGEMRKARGKGRFVFTNHFNGFIGRTTIHNDMLYMRIGLRNHRGKRFAKAFGIVVVYGDDGKEHNDNYKIILQKDT